MSDSNDFSNVIFACASNKNPSDYNLDIKLLNVLWSVDGKRTLGQIAADGGYRLEELNEMTTRLIDMGLITIPNAQNQIIDPDHFQFIVQQLSSEIGPIANIIIEDKAKAMGHSLTSFPSNKFEAFIDEIVADFPDGKHTDAIKSIIALKLQIKF